MEHIADQTMVDEYLNLIKEALDYVTDPYYNLKTTYEPSGIVRERVFCYELYHQMRRIQENTRQNKLTLNGEIDKRGHKKFARKDQKNPDFVLHIPGEMIGNTIIVEVKGQIEPNGCLKDFKTIKLFLHSYEYKLGVFILYNHTIQELREKLLDRLKREFRHPAKDEASKIFILCKKSERIRSEVANLRDLLTSFNS